MAVLAPSLKLLFKELDAGWPHRDRRTDGWYVNCVWRNHGTDHCPDSKGMVHAIDIDKDGINADWVTYKLTKMDNVVRYVIWNRHIWQHKNGWRKERYSGTPNPHTDHIHVSIEHTRYAEQYSDGYGIHAVPDAGKGGAPGGRPDAPSWDQSAEVGAATKHLAAISKDLSGYAKNIRALRR